MSDFLVNLARRSLGVAPPETPAPAPVPAFLATMETGEHAGDDVGSVSLPFEPGAPAPAIDAALPSAQTVGPLEA